MPAYRDRVKDSTTSTGTGAITLSGTAPTGYQTFATALGSSAVQNVAYAIIGGTGEWEVGKGTFNGTTGLTRDTVRDGSSGRGVLVNFSAGTKDVFVTAAAEQIDNANIGMHYAMVRGLYMP